jgi:phenylacetic acid degradation operon negative regulatory protein
MRAKTEEFLNLLLWTADMIFRPTFRNLTDSYEGWAYRNGLLRQITRLEQQRILERDKQVSEDRLYRLTGQGKICALGGRDPEAQWSRRWDGNWRMVVFDVPEKQNARREQLRRYLRRKHFGYLQNSVWITPDSLEVERQVLLGGKINVESLVLLEARPCAGESDASIVAGAWDFEGINSQYARHLKILDDCPRGTFNSKAGMKGLLRWFALEREAWREAVSGDPLLPAILLPPGYLGRTSWRQRIEVLRRAAQPLRSLRPG